LKEAEYAQRATAEKERLYRTALLYLGGEAAALDAVDEAVYQGFLHYKRRSTGACWPAAACAAPNFSPPGSPGSC